MSDYAYTRLTELDRSFLIYEGPRSPMHVGAVQIFDAAPLRGPDHAIDFERIHDYVESRLHRIPRYRQRVVSAPVDGHPIWVDDARFNLRYHLRHTRLPRPGDERTLKRTCARILEQRLDLHKPPWELWVVEGLADDRVAIVSKTHHCMIDGVSAVDLMSVLLASEPTEKIEPPPIWMPRRGPTALEYVADEALRRATAPLALARAAGDLVTNAGGARDALLERLASAGRVVTAGLRSAKPAPFNRPIGPHRRFDWITVSRDDVDLVRERLGGSLNDVVLAVVAGAMRRFLKTTRMTDVTGLELTVMAPVSLRGPADHGGPGNRVAAWLVPLPVGEPDPLARLAHIRETTARLKARHDALGVETLTQVIEWIGATPLALGARLVESAAPFHLVVTNVPGPRAPLFLLGSRMREAHPMVPLLGNLAIGIALFSYERSLSWGLNADWELVPDLHELVRAIEHGFEQLVARAKRAPAPAPPAGRASPGGETARAGKRARGRRASLRG